MTAIHTTQVVPLNPDDVRSLHVPWSSPFDSRALVEHLDRYPNRAFWMPQTGEYVIGEPWRHREDVTAIVDIVAREHGVMLVDALRDGAAPHELVVMTDFVGTRRVGFYEHLGLALIQEVICYELRAIPPEPPDEKLRFAPVTTENADDLATLLAVDHAAFPWLWWNTAAEFLAYARVPGVELFLGRDAAGEVIAYVGITHFKGWGHLDRIAVMPHVQGTGYGVAALRFAVRQLARAGATRVGLSTQANNTRSQHLYHRFGFRRTYQNDYNIYGVWVGGRR